MENEKKAKFLRTVVIWVISIFTISVALVMLKDSDKKSAKVDNYDEVIATKLNVAETKTSLTSDFKRAQEKAKKENKISFSYNGKSYKTDRSYSELTEYKVTYEFSYNDKDITTNKTYSEKESIPDKVKVYVNREDTSDILFMEPHAEAKQMKLMGYVLLIIGAILFIGVLISLITESIQKKKNKVSLDKEKEAEAEAEAESETVDLTKETVDLTKK